MSRDKEPASPVDVRHEKPILVLSEPSSLNHETDAPLSAREIELTEHIAKLEKINQALIRRVERSMDQRTNSYSLFQSAILLEEQVRSRTMELRSALGELETSNHDLSVAKEQAENSNVSKTRFLAAASHDLLQPLSAARLNMSALQTEEVSPQAGRLISQVDRSLLSIEELLRTLFDISKLDARVSVPEISRFPSERILKGLQADFGPIADQKALKLKVFSLPLQINTDPIFLRRILQNLVSNALRYTEQGGVLIGCRRRGDKLRFEVWDTGTGIDPKEHDKIFDEFHRCKTHVQQEGLGLGLAIVKRMAEAAGHEFGFRSYPSRGSVFYVTVPISEQQCALIEEPETTQERLPARLTLKDAFIVLVEDNSSVRIALKSLLDRWGAQSVAAESFSELQEKLDQVERRPDLIVADYHLMDGQVGPEVVQQVRKRYNAETMPAVIITALPQKEVLAHAAESNCELLTKPIAPAELRALLLYLINE